MEKLIIVKKYDEFLDTYEYSISYCRKYIVPLEMYYEGVEKYVTSSLVQLALQDFENLDLDKDVAIVDFTKENNNV